MKLRTAEERTAFIRANTALISPPHVPEIRLQLADEVHELWLKTESELEELGLPPPFWAFAWAGGQGLARHILDHPEIVRGKHVIDLATGSGIVAIAAAMAGAAHVTANDVDPFCGAAVKMNAHANGVLVDYRQADYISGEPIPPCDVLLAGDVFYDRAMAEGCMAMMGELAASGVEVLAGDPGRSYLPSQGLACVAELVVPVTRLLEDAEVKRTRVWRVLAQ